MQALFWDERAPKYDEVIRKHDSDYTRTVTATTALLKRSDVVLDVGCGSGEISLALAPQVRELWGIDTSGRMIELAQEKTRERRVDNATFLRTGVYDPRLQAGSFSAVTALNVIHLLGDIPRSLARLHELLEPGGRLISLTPCLGERNWLFKAAIGLAQKFALAPPIRRLTFPRLESLVSAAGFEILESEIFDEKNAVRWVLANKPS